MRHERSRAVASTLPLARIAILAIALLAVAIQIFVVQTHTHRQLLASLSVSAIGSTEGEAPAIAGVPAIPRDQLPASDDSGNCPLCQGFAHAGQFVHGGAVLAYIPAWVSVQFLVLSDAIPLLPALSHSWRGRAPPRS